MRKELLLISGALLLFAFGSISAQKKTLSAGKTPDQISRGSVHQDSWPLASVAYANDNTTNTNISIPIPDGTPFTTLGNFTAPFSATSMCKGGDGNFYLTDALRELFLFDPATGTCTSLGYMSGMGNDNPNGISYNPVNHTYYMVGFFGLYSLNINTLAASFIGNFQGNSGYIMELCFDENGTCYVYEINSNPSKAYIMNISNASLTPLGDIGFVPIYEQGMSYDFETHTIYISAFNGNTNTGQLRTMDKTTGMTTLVYDWGDQIAPFALDSDYGNPCPVSAASNPDPPSGITDVSVGGITLNWDNSTGTTNVEVWFGPTGNTAQVYNGTPITSWPTGALDYSSAYSWHIVCSNDTCGTTGPGWTFTTEQNPNFLAVDFYPVSSAYWTGRTNGETKNDGEIDANDSTVGWAVYDISGMPQYAQIQDLRFFGYVNDVYAPYWSATPMGNVNPVSDGAAAISNQILSSSGENIAYIYSDESSGFPPGWHDYPMVNGAITDFEYAINSGRGWFATGFIERSGITFFYIDFDGWSQPNPPYLEVTYTAVPVELTSFSASANEGTVVLNWQTATETNNKGFEIERQRTEGIEQSENAEWEEIGFVIGNGTSTETHSYSYTDNKVSSGNYYYRLKQIDFDGSFEYSKEIEVDVNLPAAFALLQNYPNPFNPSTTIKYSIPADHQVKLNVYSPLGEKVLTLVDGFRKAGQYEVNFDASGLPSGIYFYRLQSGTYTSVKKLILLR